MFKFRCLVVTHRKDGDVRDTKFNMANSHAMPHAVSHATLYGQYGYRTAVV